MAHGRVSSGERVPLWAQVYTRGDLVLSPEILAWMRGRCPAVRALMFRFPPHCIVRLGPLDIRAVVGYHPAGWLHCCCGLEVPRERWTWAQAERAALVQCWRGLTPDRVRKILTDSREAVPRSTGA